MSRGQCVDVEFGLKWTRNLEDCGKWTGRSEEADRGLTAKLVTQQWVVQLKEYLASKRKIDFLLDVLYCLNDLVVYSQVSNVFCRRNIEDNKPFHPRISWQQAAMTPVLLPSP